MPSVSRHRGFTLVELLVVVAIIALLIALLLPALGKARMVAEHTACLSNIRQQNVALTGYHTSNKGQMPWVRSSGNPSTCRVYPYGTLSGFGYFIREGFLGDNPESLYCPSVEIRTGSLSTRENHKETIHQRVMDNRDAATDYVLGWWGGAPSLNEFENYSTEKRFGRYPIDSDARLNVWIADCYGAFCYYYKKISHKGVFMPYGVIDGSAHSIINYDEIQPESGGAGYYHGYNDRPGWGFWRYFGSNRGLE